MSQIDRKDGEEFLDWKFRLIVGKIEGTLDIDWSEMKDLLGVDCSSDHLRKTSRGVYEAFIHFKEKDKRVNSMDFSLGKHEIEIERKKLQTEKLELNKVLRETARHELLFEKLRDSIKTIESPKFTPFTHSENSSEIGAILSIADIHWGKNFKSVNNEYSEEIAFNRMNELLSETIRIGRKEGISHLHVQNLADSIEGMTLRISQLQSLQFGMVDQTIKFSRMMTEWLNTLSKHFKLIYRHISSANHSELRPFSTSRGQFPLEDMERVVSAYIHDTLKYNERIEVPEYQTDYVRYSVCGRLIYSLHGHQINNINKVVQDLSMRHREFVDTVYLGHFHHELVKTSGANAKGNCKVIVVPSIMGSDEYSDSLMTGSKAGARLDIYRQGSKNTTTYDIVLN